MTALLDDQLVDMAFITNFTGMTDKWFYRLISENAFPAPIKLGRSSRWRKSQVEAWLLERMKLSED
ncbi:AlpA family phage regulatory protein [Citrobacter cronae]|uniref:AlpA family phage regulatory protein n=1 Tax=Citrobacter cronae TaxID=1748967 RepID=A0ABS1ACD2_9ENTR|nr:AlpA family phage regulatory protein [Citrobacter cronae]MBJ8393492.1 AlpA family phage regulatory protein [Citrobacter cronae]